MGKFRCASERGEFFNGQKRPPPQVSLDPSCQLRPIVMKSHLISQWCTDSYLYPSLFFLFFLPVFFWGFFVAVFFHFIFPHAWSFRNALIALLQVLRRPKPKLSFSRTDLKATCNLKPFNHHFWIANVIAYREE